MGVVARLALCRRRAWRTVVQFARMSKVYRTSHEETRRGGRPCVRGRLFTRPCSGEESGVLRCSMRVHRKCHRPAVWVHGLHVPACRRVRDHSARGVSGPRWNGCCSMQPQRSSCEMTGCSHELDTVHDVDSGMTVHEWCELFANARGTRPCVCSKRGAAALTLGPKRTG